jgi:non-ribosomal peptide synthetase component F
LERQRSYWLQVLAGFDGRLELPLDRPRPPVLTYGGRQITDQLPRPVLRALRALAQQQGGSLFMVLVAAFWVLLHRLTGQADLAVGTPIANRGRAELEPLIGFFVNTLVLRGRLAGNEARDEAGNEAGKEVGKGPKKWPGNPTFRALLAQAREQTLGAYSNQDLPFDQVIEAVQPRRDLSRDPLFQVMVVLQNASQGTLELPGLAIGAVEIESRLAKFDLSWDIIEGPEGLALCLTYRTALFEATTAERFQAYLKNLLTAVAAGADRPIAALEVLSRAERQQLLREWNPPPAGAYGEAPEVFCLHRRFAQVARRQPDAVAVTGQDSSLTYGALDDQADALAARLRRLGVGPEVAVALLLDRSPTLVVAVLAVLKAGGFYVPLDPEIPRERLRFILEDCAAALLLTDGSAAAEAAVQVATGIQGLLVVSLAADPAAEIEAEAGAKTLPAELASGAHDEQLAYLLYTSGSTGRPRWPAC